MKRAFDLSLTLVTAPVWLAVCGAMAIALAVDLRGSPIFVQRRIGLHGTPFQLVKLRTMRHAAGGVEPGYTIESWDTFVFSPPDQPDPRITRLGAFARKTSIDELPNLFNVIRGEMSLVGPRPEIPEIVDQYPPEYRPRHDVLPGIAGLAQVEGRSDLAYAEVMKYDLAYVDDHSFSGDLRILARSLVAVVKGSGAR